MEIIMLSGGLGNQMFQYAFYLQRRKLMGSNVFIDDYSIKKERTHNGLELNSLFGIAPTPISPVKKIIIRVVRKIHILGKSKKTAAFSKVAFALLAFLNINVIEEKEDGVFNKAYLEEKKGLSVYFGYWQTEKYFIDLKEQIRKQYSFDRNRLSEKSKDLYELIRKGPSVSIHIRKGDYLSPEYYLTHGSICNNDYYEQGISFILNKQRASTFFVFSDDIEWVKKNLNIPEPAFYVNWNNGKDSWQDMFLMSQCKDNIIANSSFSWWGAWLNSNPEKTVISPSHFLANKKTVDIVPDTWIKL